jgi:hypothetical protein
MKIILSKKGFDKSGDTANPIFPDGGMFSLPIPDSASGIRYEEVLSGRKDYPTAISILKALGKGEAWSERQAHLDPDLLPGNCAQRLPGWRPSLGTEKKAYGHLSDQGVTEGDIFLFYGWFQKVEPDKNGGLKSDGIDRQVIWGWLQIGEICPIETARGYEWLQTHPHVRRYGDEGLAKYIYIAAPSLQAPGSGLENIPGAGVFGRYKEQLLLNEPGKNLTDWRLPAFFYPTAGKPPLSWCSDDDNWRLADGFCYVQKTANRGQESVLQDDYWPEAARWLAGLFD